VQLLSSNTISLDGFSCGEECFHVADEGAGHGGRQFYWRAGHEPEDRHFGRAAEEAAVTKRSRLRD
jgi:hypothetical protein